LSLKTTPPHASDVEKQRGQRLVGVDRRAPLRQAAGEPNQTDKCDLRSKCETSLQAAENGVEERKSSFVSGNMTPPANFHSALRFYHIGQRSDPTRSLCLIGLRHTPEPVDWYSGRWTAVIGDQLRALAGSASMRLRGRQAIGWPCARSAPRRLRRGRMLPAYRMSIHRRYLTAWNNAYSCSGGRLEGIIVDNCPNPGLRCQRHVFGRAVRKLHHQPSTIASIAAIPCQRPHSTGLQEATPPPCSMSAN
jgi:hypothetical protein